MNSKNTLNLLQVHGGNYIKQTDRASIVGYQLQNACRKRCTALEGKIAYITLSDRVNDRFYRKTSYVTNSIVDFRIDSSMESGIYDVKIEVDGYVFPSNERISLNISPSNSSTKIITPDGFDLSAFITRDELNKKADKIHTHVMDDITDVNRVNDDDINKLFN